MTSMLLGAGHRDDIWVVGETPSTSLPGTERMEGVRAALAAQRVELAGQLTCPWWPEAAYDALWSALGDGVRPQAIVCLNDRIAFGVYQALESFGLRIPADVSVVSFDDSELASWLRPAVTSVGLPEFEMGRLAVETLLAKETPPVLQRVLMPVRARDSVAAPPPATVGRG